mgnify:CR=1 FL=1
MQTMARRSSGTKGYTGYRGRRRGRGVLAVVLVGIYIPARRISSIPPTEALRDE